MRIKILYSILILCFLTSCEKANDTGFDNFIKTDFIELFNDSIPPCLVGINEIVIKNQSDYDTIKRTHAPQGDYENFQGDGQQARFKLSYQPLDSDFDGKIGPSDLAIYVKDKPIVVNISGNEINVSSNPFHIRNDSILIFSEEYPYTVVNKIHYTEVFNVNSDDGEIIFNTPPPFGSDIWICGLKKLYDTYDNRQCSLDDFDLENKIIIGNSAGGDGCFIGFDIELLVDTLDKELIYLATINIKETDMGCPEIFWSETKWILIENIQEDYKVNFKYETKYIKQ